MAISNVSSGARPGVCTSTTRPQAPFKTCSTCKQEQPIENFSKDRTQPTGVNYQCKSCRSKINLKSYRQEKLEVDTHQICTLCHIEKEIDEFYKDARGRNGRFTRCKECHIKTTIVNNKKNPQSRRHAVKRWKEKNPDKIRVFDSNAKARRRLAEQKEFSTKDWKSLIERYEGCCAYCGCSGVMTMDHVVPLTRGGRHSVGNIVPACHSCNSSKNNRFIVEWRKSKWA